MTGSWRSWSGCFGFIKNRRNLLPPEEKENRLREIAATDAEIDALVSDLYGLTAEEIRLLEQSGRTTEG